MLAVTPFNRIMSSATQTKNISGMMRETGQRIHSLLNSPGLNLTKHLLEKSKSNQWKPHHNQPQRHSVHRPVALKCFVLYHWVKKNHILNVCLYEAHRTTVGLCGGFGVVEECKPKEASGFT